MKYGMQYSMSSDKLEKNNVPTFQWKWNRQLTRPGLKKVQSGDVTILSVMVVSLTLSEWLCMVLMNIVIFISVSYFCKVLTNFAAHCNLYTPPKHYCVLFYHTGDMSSAVLKFLSLVIICIVIIDGVLCHEEGKTPTTSECSHLPLNISYTNL